MIDYYKQKQYIAQVDKNDKILGKIEKWNAHKKGVLHRAFTMILIYQNKFILQHRKHPVFDGFFDLTFSSHQIFADDKLEDDLTAIYKSLKREWNLERSGLTTLPKKIGQIYYKAKDPNSEFFDHEIDYIYEGTLKNLPTPNYNFAYGFSMVDRKLITDNRSPITNSLAPWVKVMIEEKLI